MKSMPCIVCHEELENVTEGLIAVQPSGGTAFSSYGHYGSGVWDPMDGSGLLINVCDGCMRAAPAECILRAGNQHGDYVVLGKGLGEGSDLQP